MPCFTDELAGGTVGGVIGMSIVYPLDTVKLRYGGMMHRVLSLLLYPPSIGMDYSSTVVILYSPYTILYKYSTS